MDPGIWMVQEWKPTGSQPDAETGFWTMKLEKKRFVAKGGPFKTPQAAQTFIEEVIRSCEIPAGSSPSPSNPPSSASTVKTSETAPPSASSAAPNS